MKDLRFTGHLGGSYVDIRLRTDMINSTDSNFNITQIQEGQEFDTNDKKSLLFQKYFSGTFKETNNTISAAKQFAIDNALGLRMYGGDGKFESFLVNDTSASAN